MKIFHNLSLCLSIIAIVVALYMILNGVGPLKKRNYNDDDIQYPMSSREGISDKYDSMCMDGVNDKCYSLMCSDKYKETGHIQKGSNVYKICSLK